ncbi:MAG TPA: hypothetical protein VMR50_13090 [Myxococcota bacterium]|nr:hypothetical protein [Myxococcota bacterium]
MSCQDARWSRGEDDRKTERSRSLALKVLSFCAVALAAGLFLIHFS